MYSITLTLHNESFCKQVKAIQNLSAIVFCTSLIIAFVGISINSGVAVSIITTCLLLISLLSIVLLLVSALIPVKPKYLGVATITGTTLSIQTPDVELINDISRLKILLSTQAGKPNKTALLTIDDFDGLSRWNNYLVIHCENTEEAYRFSFEPEVTLLQLTEVEIVICNNKSILLSDTKDILSFFAETLNIAS